MSTKASGIQKYYTKALQHQKEFLNEIWHFESQRLGCTPQGPLRLNPLIFVRSGWNHRRNIFKSPCLREVSNLWDTFHKWYFYDIWSKCSLKLFVWSISGVSRTDFSLSRVILLKMSQNGCNSEFMAFFKKMVWKYRKNIENDSVV